MHRTSSVKEIWQAVEDNATYFEHSDVIEWLQDKRNMAIVEGNNIALFEYKSPGTYWGHYFYKSAKGRGAINLSKRILEHVFSVYPVTTLLGLTPEDNRKARWLSRQIGMSSLGMVDTVNGQCELFLKTRN